MPYDVNDIADPGRARQTGEELGEKIAEGMGVGLDRKSVEAVTAAKNVYVELETVTKNAAKNAENLAKKRQKRELDNLKNSLNLGLICEQEYYEKLKEYRDKNLREGTDAWFKATEEIAEYNKKIMDMQAEAEAEYRKLVEKNIRETAELHRKLSEKLASELKGDEPWASRQKVTIYDANPDGSDIVYTRDSLEDFDYQIRLLERYGKLMEELYGLGKIPSGVFAELGEMDVEDAMKTAEVLLGASPEKLDKFISGYNRRDQLAGKLGDELSLIFNSGEISRAAEECARAFEEGYFGADDGNKSRFIQILEESFKEIPDSYYGLGENSGDAFSKGFREKLDALLNQAKLDIVAAMQSINFGVVSLSGSGAGAGVTTSNVFNTSYTFNGSKDTTTMQLSAARNAAALERLRGGEQ